MTLYIASTMSCFLLGLCLYGMTWAFFGMQDEEWWLCSCRVRPHVLGVFGLTFLSLILVKALSRNHTEEEVQENATFGVLNMKLGEAFPQEVDVISMLLGWAWSRFFLGAVKEMTAHGPES